MVKDVDHFPKIKDYNVEFACVSPIKTFRINEPAVLVFRLTNLSEKSLVVYEWKMIDDYNMKLFVAPWQEGTPIPEQDKWVCIAPPVKKNSRSPNPGSLSIFDLYILTFCHIIIAF